MMHFEYKMAHKICHFLPARTVVISSMLISPSPSMSALSKIMLTTVSSRASGRLSCLHKAPLFFLNFSDVCFEPVLVN
eukprot:COSAG06_NODE_685_length_13103_cov_126.328668_9_plen_78_part_00